ncbi:MarR family winged helix-turn-helix transcriptional regulator [Fusibacter ferrireducens]|uniref:HTH-type transcriptional regulator SarZ n=1 Tax=Fusibacter ferrireducens TaxID=2785058 RepID=A0ABR9ZRA9_9FIRM|nr:MarR family transcriptional regulator [Fusibacter ferrireducens]MBF4692993.1 MarR family transcriptional regulator [Fusibacter ferrireducens]
MDYDQLKLENQLCFPLYAASKMTTRLYKPLLEPFELTYTQYITLLSLWEKDGVTVNELGATLYLDSGTMTPLLKKLEKKGWVSKSRSVEDERTVLIYLTEEGWQLRAQVADIPSKLAKCLDLPMSDILSLHRILHQMLNAQIEREEKQNLSHHPMSQTDFR